mgnify:CR=1 FL=1
MSEDLRTAALEYHAKPRPGKISVEVTKPAATSRDLSLAYSPGVAEPVREIAREPELAYRFTAKGNLVAVISDGTAILGLGNLGALASKPVMEGKGILFKLFAGIDVFDIEVDAEDSQAFIDTVVRIHRTFGGINLEDIRAPECFEIERILKEQCDVPVFHDDQHGTAIVVGAGLINALEIQKKRIEDIKVVCVGAGAAGVASVRLLIEMGARKENILVLDRKGVIHSRRDDLNQYKAALANDTDKRTLNDAVEDADVFIGVSGPDMLTPEMVKKRAPKPIIFALANPDPEIRPEEADGLAAVMATGRSDYPNQINNVLGFPYIFRGALDVRASQINDAMKIAAAQALAALARQDVPDEVDAAYGGRRMRYGSNYLIPVPFDPRLITTVPPAVAQAAMDSGVAQAPIADFDEYRHKLKARLNPTTAALTNIYDLARANPKPMVFAEAEEDVALRAAIQYREFGYGEPILVGRTEKVLEKLRELAVDDPDDWIIENSNVSDKVPAMVDYLYKRLQRRGYTERDVARMVNQERNVFAALLVALGHGEGMITGLTRTFSQTAREVGRVLDAKPGATPFGIHMMVGKNHTSFLADTTMNERPSAGELAYIARETAAVARRMGHEPRVAFLSYSTFGNPSGQWLGNIRDAVALLDADDSVNFEYEGEMAPDVALNPKLMANYPFSRLSGPANVLIMPGLQSANLSAKLLRELGGETTIGPLMIGSEKPVQIAPMTAIAPDVLTLAVLASAGVVG